MQWDLNQCSNDKFRVGFLAFCLILQKIVLENLLGWRVSSPPSWNIRMCPYLGIRSLQVKLFRWGHTGASLVAQTVKNLPAIQETWAQSLSWEDPLKKGMATHSSILAWKIPWAEEPGGLQSMGSQRVGHDWVTNTPHWSKAGVLIRRDAQSHRREMAMWWLVKTGNMLLQTREWQGLLATWRS